MSAVDHDTSLRPPPPLAKRLALLFAILIIAGLFVGIGVRLVEASREQEEFARAREASAARAGEAPEVEVMRPLEATYTPVVVLQGTLEPVRSADLGFQISGRILRVDVALGQQVRDGETLVTLDRASLGALSAQSEAAIAVAEANVEMSRDRVSVLERLTTSGAAPERELTTARQQLAVAEAQLAQARTGRRQITTSTADHVLRAPFNGVATDVPTGVGAVTGPGVSLVRIEDLSSLRLRTTVNQSELEALRVGATAIIEGHEGVHGTIQSVVRSLDPQTRRAPVEVLVPNPTGRLIANAVVRANVVVGPPSPALRIAATARRPNGTVLVVPESGQVESRAIEAISDLDGSWLVTSGLSPRDQVVRRPATTREGQTVVARLSEETESASARTALAD